MKAINKITNEVYSICPILGGYQISKTHYKEWEQISASEVYFLTDDEFNDNFNLC